MSLGGLERDSGRAVGGRMLFKEINDKTIDGLTGTDSLWQVNVGDMKHGVRRAGVELIGPK